MYIHLENIIKMEFYDVCIRCVLNQQYSNCNKRKHIKIEKNGEKKMKKYKRGMEMYARDKRKRKRRKEKKNQHHHGGGTLTTFSGNHQINA